jgi:hypothetical protein
MELSRFGAANNVPNGADVDVEVTVGEDGRASAFVLNPRPLRPLDLELEYYLRSRTTYDAKCSGKKVRLRFSFRVDGEPQYIPFVRVRFRPPNHFLISTQPMKSDPQIIPVPSKPEGEKP